MQPSPYTPGEVAKAVPGRAHQLAEIEERLSVLADLRRLVGRIRVDHAPRGFGKTSLLREYQRRATAHGVLTAWVTAGEPHGLVVQLRQALMAAAGSLDESSRLRLRAHLDSVSLTLGIPGVAEVAGTISTLDNDDDLLGARALESLIRKTTELAGGLVVFVDEIQAADDAGLRTLVYAWQHLQIEGADVPAAVFAAGLPNAPERIASIVTFSERIAYRPLGSLEREAEEVALIAPARAVGVDWTPGAVELALSVAQGYPYALQLIADAAWTVAGRPDPGRHIDTEDVARGRLVMRADVEALFRARWAGCTPLERRLLTAMAGRGDGPVARADRGIAVRVAERALRTASAADRQGARATADRGQLVFTIPGFAAFLRGLEDV